ncbi:MAG: hypothetical protein CL532_02805 [Aestuariivita sp.]|nr:hypothetical protein [Aestuariivita sp.]
MSDRLDKLNRRARSFGPAFWWHAQRPYLGTYVWWGDVHGSHIGNQFCQNERCTACHGGGCGPVYSVFSLGQILGPIGSGYVLDQTGDSVWILLLSGSILIIGMLSAFLQPVMTPPEIATDSASTL